MTLLYLLHSDADKRAAVQAKRQLQESKKADKPPPTGDVSTVNGDIEPAKPPMINGAGTHDKNTPDEPRSPMKKPLAEIPMYPTIKAQSLPIPSQTLKERNKRVGAGEAGKVSLPKVDVFSSSEVEDSSVSTKDGNKKKKVKGGLRSALGWEFCSPPIPLCSGLAQPCTHHAVTDCTVTCSPKV